MKTLTRKLMNLVLWLIFVISIFLGDHGSSFVSVRQAEGECTIGVFSGSVTSDGRPIIWKNRDIYDPDQRYIYYASYQRDGVTTIPFTGDCFRRDTTRIYMGANARGFAILNSDSFNLNDSLWSGIDDGTLMRLALETCVTLSDFARLLDSTNVIGRLDCWNFGCLDSTGAAAMFECANRRYWKFDANNSDTPVPGIILRANYSMMGNNNLSGYDRYKRAVDLTLKQLASQPLDVAFVLQSLARDLGNVFDNPYPLPYHGSQVQGPPGYIYNFGCTIANRSTTAVVAIRGITQNETPLYTTIFAILGQPVLAPAFPLWVGSATVPIYLSAPGGAPVYNYCAARSSRLYDNSMAPYHLNSRALVNDDSNGVYSYIIPLENWGIRQADMLLNSWQDSLPTSSDMSWEQFRIARVIFRGFELETATFIDTEPDYIPQLPNSLSIYSYPNPFNENTRLVFSGTDSHFDTRVMIYDIMGRLVTEIPGTNVELGYVYWAGRDASGQKVSSGVYLCTLVNGPHTITNKMLYLK